MGSLENWVTKQERLRGEDEVSQGHWCSEMGIFVVIENGNLDIKTL